MDCLSPLSSTSSSRWGHFLARVTSLNLQKNRLFHSKKTSWKPLWALKIKNSVWAYIRLTFSDPVVLCVWAYDLSSVSCNPRSGFCIQELIIPLLLPRPNNASELCHSMKKTQKSHELFFIYCSVDLLTIYIYVRCGLPVSHTLSLLLLDWNSQTGSSKMATSSYTFPNWRHAGVWYGYCFFSFDQGVSILFRQDFSVLGASHVVRKEVKWWAWVYYFLTPSYFVRLRFFFR